MQFLNGFKTIIGLIGTVVTVLAPRVAPDLVTGIGDAAVTIGQGVFGLLLALGVIHKVEKKVNGTR